MIHWPGQALLKQGEGKDMEKDFKWQLGTCVEIAASGEQGIVIGRAQYSYAEDGYLIRYAARDGRAVENWWTESALK